MPELIEDQAARRIAIRLIDLEIILVQMVARNPAYKQKTPGSNSGGFLSIK